MTAGPAARPSWIEYDLDALAHNYREIAGRLAPHTRMIAALKGNAYGHGAAAVARRLADEGVFALSTGSLEDAAEIRAAGIGLPVLMFAGAIPAGIPGLLDLQLTPTVCDIAMAKAVSEVSGGPHPIYIKVDAGLGRIGVRLEEALPFIREVAALPNVALEGVYTHLPFQNAEGRAWARARLAAFDALLDDLDAAGIRVPVTQALASSGIAAGLESRANAVCPGHLLYGLAPFEPGLDDIDGFRPVLSAIRSRLIKVGPPSDAMLPPSNRPRAVGVLPLGRHDGYRRPAQGSQAMALLEGRSVPVTRVSLEHMVLDLSEFDGAAVGDEITLLGSSGGETITLDDLAAWWGDSPLDVTLSFDGRLPADYLNRNFIPSLQKVGTSS